MLITARKPITLPTTERQQVQELERLLTTEKPTLVGLSGGRVELPETVYAVLRKVVELMAQGQTVSIVSESQAVTTQRAANILGMSRPFFIKLLETGVMAYHRVGNQRRVLLSDVLRFAKNRDEERQASLDRLSRQAFESGLYDRNRMPDDGQDE
jgi:excisionase family DNA binding protein